MVSPLLKNEVFNGVGYILAYNLTQIILGVIKRLNFPSLLTFILDEHLHETYMLHTTICLSMPTTPITRLQYHTITLLRLNIFLQIAIDYYLHFTYPTSTNPLLRTSIFVHQHDDSTTMTHLIVRPNIEIFFYVFHQPQ